MAVLVDASRGGRGAASFAPLLRRRASGFLKTLKLDRCELSICLVGDPEIRRLNRRWRKLDQATDVLSFSAGGWLGAGPRPLGDIVISLATTRRAARTLGSSVEEELSRYLAHGLLHLLGHDHHRRAEATKMEEAEERLLGRPGMLRTSSPSRQAACVSLGEPGPKSGLYQRATKVKAIAATSIITKKMP